MTTALAQRRIVNRTSGLGGNPITRLMSPSDLGQILKPFVFLDHFTAGAQFVGAMPIHPHSGIATITVLTEGNARFDDPDSGTGVMDYGGVEWMRAGAGVWHGQEMSAGTSERVSGFQLWVALPPELENAASESQYLEGVSIPEAGPAKVILGQYERAVSPVRAPAGMNYLLVTLRHGEIWRYTPPSGHLIAWAAVASGSILAGEAVARGELVIFEHGPESIEFETNGDEDAVFVLGSAVPHPYDLVLGNYSVHTTQAALRQGEERIARLGDQLRRQGSVKRSGATPVFR